MTQTELDKKTGVVTLSLKTDGNLQIAPNFKVREMRCKDGTDKILCNVDVVRNILQPIRDWAGASVNITSAYRTLLHNLKVGGDKNSTHLTGNAFDVKVTGKTIQEVAKKAEELGAVCILVYENQNFVHIGFKKNKDYRIKSKTGQWTTVQSFTGCPYKEPTYTLYRGKLLMSKEYVKWLQWHLQRLGYYTGEIDGSWGPKTTVAYDKFQAAYPETGTNGKPDGKVGPAARKVIKSL